MSAQSLNKMKDERAQLEKQIAESKKLLASTDNNVKGQLSKLSVLSEQIKKQQAIVNSLDKEIKTMNNEIAANEQRQRELELDLSKRKNNYAHALQLSVQKNTFEKRLTFLFSADSFRQMYRRARYLREYSDFQAKQGREIQSKRLELEKKKEELVQLRTEKQTLFTQQQAEQQTLAQQQAEQQKIVKQLQKKQADIKSEIKRQQNEYNQLNKKIDQLIAEQIAASQKKKNNGQKTEKGSQSFKMSEEDVKLSGSFAANKGKLPVPVLGPYLLVNHYGINQVQGMKDVKVNNQGVDIRCGSNATIRSIYEGEVSAIFVHPTRQTYGVLVRHGEYISVYCNLATINVKQGDKVKINSPIGIAANESSGDHILQFQLRRGQQPLNPEEWIRF